MELKKRHGMNDFVKVLTAGVPQFIDWNGDAFHVLESTTYVTLRFDEGGQKIKRKAGQGGSAPTEFGRVEVVSEVDQTVRISVGYGSVQDSTANVTGNVTATWASSNSNPDAGDVVIPSGQTVQVIGANTKRQKLHIFAGENNIQNLRVGGPLTDATHGGILAPGGNGVLETEAAIYVFNPGAAPETVSIIEMERL